MIAGAIGARLGIQMVEARDDLDLLLDARERRHGLIELERRPSPLGHQWSRLQPFGKVTKAMRTGAAAAPASDSAARARPGDREGRAGNAMHAPTPFKNRRRVQPAGAAESWRSTLRWLCAMIRSLHRADEPSAAACCSGSGCAASLSAVARCC